VTAKGSWQFKFDRAQEHMRDLRDEITRYANRHPYRAERIPPTRGDDGLWTYVLRVTEQPDPRVAILAGDVVHNLRTSLDHLFVALTGADNRSFPIYDVDPWERDAQGALLPSRLKDRRRFAATIQGAKPRAKAILRELQPYRAGASWNTHPLGVVRRLNNADKHKRLIPTATGVSEGLSAVARVSQVVHMFYWPYTEDGAEVAKFKWDPPEPPESDVHVRVSGTPRIAVGIPTDPRKVIELLQALEWTISRMPDDVFSPLERWVL
jgi:hypothetical protein